MTTPSAREVSVIGAGMIGVCSALYLQREGFRVTLIDPNPPGSGTSYGNAGCLGEASIVPMSMPGVLRQVPGYLADPAGPLVIRWRYLPTLAPWLWRFVRSGARARVEAQARALRSLLGPVIQNLMPLVQQAGAEHLIRRDGMLYVYRSEQGFSKDALGWDLRRRNGIAFEPLTSDALRSFEPALSPEFRQAVFVPGNGHIVDPQGLVSHLAQAAIHAGAKLVAARACGFSLSAGRLTGVQVEGATLAADAAVIACGAHSRSLAAAVDDRVPLDTERGYHVMLRTPEVMPRVPVLDAERKFIATPMRGGLRVAGIVEFAGFERAPDPRINRRLLAHARDMLPALRGEYPDSEVAKWMGFRPSMPDSLPVIGRAHACRDIIHAFGHGHVGMCGGATTGKLVAELLAGREPSIDISPFSPMRFS